MKKNSCFWGIILLSVLFVSCGTTTRGLKSEVFAEMYGEKPPVSILVMPPINTTSNVDAKDYFYYTLNQTLADSGYYVYPSLLAMETLQSESAYDSELFVDGDISKFGSTFGADLVLFTTITRWEKSVVGSKVIVEIDYNFRSTSTGNTVYHRATTFTCNTAAQSSGGGLFALALQAALSVAQTALTDYVRVARACNYTSLSGDLPAGKYNEARFGVDGAESAGAEQAGFMVNLNRLPY
ncbi:MAG: DUF799 family lipoprotein [Treponema sp.]|nr:DUF799 family lipoprotein [Treponema sp.]